MKENLKLLIIEDNQGDIFLMQEMLAESIKQSYEIEVAFSLASGLKKLNADGMDAVLLDLSLPDSNGALDSVQRVRETNNQVPVVVITGNEDEDLGLEAVKMGAQDYIQKEYLNPYILSRSIQYAIERHQLLLEIEALKQSQNS